MRRKQWKRVTAILAAVSLLVQVPYFNPVQISAQPLSAAVTQGNKTVSVNEIADFEIEADTYAVDEEGCITDASKSLSENQTYAEKTESAPSALAFVYVEKEEMQKGQSQSIVVSLMPCEKKISSATLVLLERNTKQQIQLEASLIMDQALRFDTGEHLQEGIYQILKVGYSPEGEDKAETAFKALPELYWIDITKERGMEEICFGVGCKVPSLAQDFISLDTLSKVKELGSIEEANIIAEAEGMNRVETNVVSISGREDSSLVSKSVEEAIKDAKGELSKSANAGEIQSERKTAGSLVVVLDPGHDATHAGTRRGGLLEENITLQIALYCKAYLEANYTDVVVHMTRSTAACPHPGTTSSTDNSLRVADAKNVGADVYVSFHINATEGNSTGASGAIVFYPNANYNSAIGMSGASLSSMIIQQLEKLGLKNNGTRVQNHSSYKYPDGTAADSLGVIRWCKENGITGVLIEHAFINNAADAAFLSSEENLKKMGYADALGIANAYNLSTEEVQYDADEITVTEIDGASGSFSMTLLGATPVDRIKNICFKVYPLADSSKSYFYTATADTKKKGVYRVTGNVSNHGNADGKYKVIAYAQNAAGKKIQLRSTTFTIEESKIETAEMTLTTKLDRKQTKATICLKNNETAASVSFRVYSVENGTDDRKTYKATKQQDGSWLATVPIKDHGTAGEYAISAYSKSYFGTTTLVKKGSFRVDGPSMKAIRVKAINLNKGTFQLRTDNAFAPSGIKDVQITVRNLSGKKKRVTYTAKKNSADEYTVKVDMKNHDYQMGKYRIMVKVTDKTNITKQLINRVYDFGAPANKITATLKAKQTKLSLSASSLGINTSIEAVKFRVYNATTKSKKKSYEAKKNTSGVWVATVKIQDFAQAGTYKVSTYVKRKGQGYKKLETTKSVTVQDVSGGKFSTKNKGKKTYMYVSDIASKASVSSVKIKVWPDGKRSANYVYTAKEYDEGKYKVACNMLLHGNKEGIYRYTVTVTLKNGIEKQILKGKFNPKTEVADPTENGYYTITGASTVTIDQMVAYYKEKANYPGFYASTDASTLKRFCTIYFNECEAEGIRAEVAFAQAMKETNFLRFGGDVGIGQFNFAGLGATGGGAKGNSFASVTLGVRAQIQHLKAYANTQSLKNACVDPRFIYVTRGTAPYVEWLGIPDNPYGKGWATDRNYGSSILGMIDEMKTF